MLQLICLSASVLTVAAMKSALGLNQCSRILRVMSSSNYSLKRFIEDTEAIARKNPAESDVLRGIKPFLERLIANPNAVPADAFKPRHDRFAMNLIYMPNDKSFSVIGGVWKPGQTTPIHDHLTWALIGVYEGEEREALYRRIDDGSNPKMAKLKMVSTRINKRGHVTVLGKAGMHKVDNISEKTARSIHIYGLDIGSTERHSYDPVTGEIGTFLTGYCNVLRDFDPF